MLVHSLADPVLVELIRQGKIGVLPTDTLYGIHASIKHPNSIERIYTLRGRSLTKPFIILISKIDDISNLGITIDNQTSAAIAKIWPNKVSLVLPTNDPKLKYLHRGNNSLAFRMPNKPDLLSLIEKTGPIVSTSVNPEGEAPALTIDEAKKYFADKLDFYVDVGKLESAPSTVITFKKGKIEVLRQGACKITS